MELIPHTYQCHIFVCVNEREQGECCGTTDAVQIVQQLRHHINTNRLFDRYNVTKSRCLGHCQEGPVIAIYPQGHIFKKVTLADVKSIIEHFLPVDS